MLMPFSIPEHVPLLLSGQKRQTTRHPREVPLKVGDTLHCYYKPRQKKTCGNCIVQDCKQHACEIAGICVSICSDHRTFLGKAEVISIIHFGKIVYTRHREYQELATVFGCEQHLDFFGNQNEEFMEAWARADGFECLQDANIWFTSTGNDQWMFQAFDVIIFEPMWLLKRDSMKTVPAGKKASCLEVP